MPGAMGSLLTAGCGAGVGSVGAGVGDDGAGVACESATAGAHVPKKNNTASTNT